MKDNRKAEISVIIPVFNGAPYVRSCYSSIAAQTFHEIEVIFVDDGSTDNTKEIVEAICAIDNRVNLVSKHNEGQGVARNVGLGLATGKYVSFIDVDDKLPSDAYEALFASIESFSADVVYGLSAAEGREEDYGLIEAKSYEGEESLAELAAMIVGGLPEDREDSLLGMSVCRCLFRRSLLEENNIRFASERLVNSEDLLFNMDVLAVCDKAVLLNKVVYTICYGANPDSFSKRYNPNRMEMFVRLREEMMKRAGRWSRFSGFGVRVERRFLANCRVSIKQAVFSEGILNDRLSRIKDVLSNERFRESLSGYPIESLPIKQRVFFLAAKLRIAILIYILVLMRYRGAAS